ncbi:MAG: gamma-glutamylcyclotransferase family protein [Paracoccaceae bacterium]
MRDPFFFGYGSLVNRATHDYAQARPARLRGWRRAWRHTRMRKLAYLTAEREADSEIDGLVAVVPGADWAALDLREAAYERHWIAPQDIHHDAGHPIEVQLYVVDPVHSEPPSVRHPILLSYIDTVAQGFLREFGPEGLTRFFATTAGWDAPILDDRAAPVYPRAQSLTAGEKAAVDGQLAFCGAALIRP